MSRWIPILLAPLLLGLLFAACSQGTTRQPPAPASGARLEVDESVVDFGPVEYDELKTAAFTLKNVGNAPLALREVGVELVEGC